MLRLASLKARMSEYSFYHVIEVAPGLFTPGIQAFVSSQQPLLEYVRNFDLSGKRVLDIGCRDGLFSFAAERAGAKEVLGIDNDLSSGAINFLIPHFRSRVTMRQLNIFSLPPADIGKFDVIIFSGVLYHLRFPFYALQIVHDLMVDGGELLLETAVSPLWPNYSALFCPRGEESPYEPTSVSFFNHKGLYETLKSFGFLPHWTKVLPSATQGRPDRVTAACKLVRTSCDDDLEQYWLALHSNHSSGDPRHRFGE